METFTYILSFDPDATAFSLPQLHTLVTSHGLIVSWYLPFRGTYLMKSETPLLILIESFRPIFNGAPFLMAALSPSVTGGAFAPAIWNWVNSGELPKLGN